MLMLSLNTEKWGLFTVTKIVFVFDIDGIESIVYIVHCIATNARTFNYKIEKLYSRAMR